MELHVLVDYSGKFPYGKSCDGCEQYEERVGAEYYACDDYGYKYCTRDCTNDKVFHFEVRLRGVRQTFLKMRFL